MPYAGFNFTVQAEVAVQNSVWFRPTYDIGGYTTCFAANNDNLLHDETMAIYCTTNTTQGSCVVCCSVEGLVSSSEGKVVHKSAMEADSKLEPHVHGL